MQISFLKINRLIFSLCFLSIPFTSLANNTPQTNKPQLPNQCVRLFAETKNLIEEAAQQPGTHPEIPQIQNQLLASQNKILTLKLEDQIKSCDRGLIALNHLKQKNDD
ncbi:DUF5339 domain-containing protein [Mergibacter septicus]|uniref:DUF5339 domain-containing protein n=1 Tax=Mergibacter septicus TaxID=221402 RepID=UPI0021C3326E|nr:DUF5339 domain-containing protein [Mergibacter septicus]UTU48254.1 DUF5339 domain-containing protein [Mergibacter septicus]WMR96128.1 DUF5339 domain-containing protein [Mergibacter septicus]